MKVIVLCISLLVVLYGMTNIRHNKTFQAIFGVESSQEPAGATITRGKLTLCPTRVLELEYLRTAPPEEVKTYFQQGIKWFVKGSQNGELDPLFMEKWLAEFCEVQIDRFTETTSDRVSGSLAKLKFKLIDGHELIIDFLGEGMFNTPNGVVESEELLKALKQIDPTI